ncbi:MAG: leucine-rich repeat domain-containing protein [Bacteroidaceae bacterium]|nr:leucine-rich repeat domain-containing protein [Bacteroidaceae bacterium]
MRKRFFITLLLAATFSLSALAGGTEIGGIHYELDRNNNSACVTFTGSSYKENNNYPGRLTIPASVTHGGVTYTVTAIGDYAFYYCSSLLRITLPGTVTSIGEGAFAGCTGFTSFTIPTSVTHIGESAFYDCTRLTSITIPNSVVTIGDMAFYNCNRMTSAALGNNVDSIGDKAFAYCTELTSFSFGNSIKKIGDNAFEGCFGLTSITLPASVTHIGNGAFAYCTELQQVYCRCTTPPTLGEKAFPAELMESGGCCKLYVPASRKQAYAANWGWFENRIQEK